MPPRAPSAAALLTAVTAPEPPPVGAVRKDAARAFNHPVRYEDLDDGFIGPTRSARLIELGVLDTDRGPVIVHAMTARRKYLR